MIKECNITGLKYLCKTSGKNPYLYHGSGIRWKLHYNKYHKDNPNITTIILGEYSSKEELKEAGLYYSKKFNIVNDPNWANLTPEQGDGGWINDQSGKHWKIKDTSNMKGSKTQTERMQKGREKTKGKNNYQFAGFIQTPWGTFESIQDAITEAKKQRQNGNKEVISDAKTLHKYLNSTKVLNPEGRRTPKSWRGKSPVELGFKRIHNAKD